MGKPSAQVLLMQAQKKIRQLEIDQQQCAGCTYWKHLGWSWSSEKACHHLLDTGKMRQMDGDRCLSRTEGKTKRKKDPFEVPAAQR